MTVCESRTVDSARGQVVGDRRGHLVVERAEQVLTALHERDRESALREVVGHLDADVAAADDDGGPAGLYGRGLGHEPVEVVERAQRVQRRAGGDMVGPARCCAG